ncbi:MAG: sigma-70 family RNA polymerase sigma factor [Armatimonadia bacterium]|nr:sigma-70 family RNA polymerase sigma factor [Armatimonadia bacterium]
MASSVFVNHRAPSRRAERRGLGVPGAEGVGAVSQSDRSTPDEVLVRRVLAGDTEAFAPIVERYHSAMLAASMQMIGDTELAHDCAQEAFIEGFRSLSNLRDHSSLRSWLFGILRNRCRKALSRRRLRTLPLEDETDIPADSHDERDAPDRQRLMDLLSELPDSYREVLAARYLADMEYEEIAEALGTSVNNVRVRCCRARERLRAILDRRGIGREGLLGDA